MSISIRTARSHDLFALEALLVSGYEEAPEFYPPYDPAYFHASMLGLINQGLVMVAVETDTQGVERIVGTMVFEIACWPWAPAHKFLETLYWYVLPEARPSGAARAMLEAVASIADAHGVQVSLRITSDSDAELKGKFAQMHGFEPLGGHYMRQPRSGGAVAPVAERAAA